VLGVSAATLGLVAGCGGSTAHTTLPPAEYAAELQVATYVRAYDAILATTTHPPAHPRDLRKALALEDQTIRDLKALVPPRGFENDHKAVIAALERERSTIGLAARAIASHAPIAESNAQSQIGSAQAGVNEAIQKLGSELRACYSAHTTPDW
jgi:hypothetical protein